MRDAASAPKADREDLFRSNRWSWLSVFLWYLRGIIMEQAMDYGPFLKLVIKLVFDSEKLWLSVTNFE